MGLHILFGKLLGCRLPGGCWLPTVVFSALLLVLSWAPTTGTASGKVSKLPTPHSQPADSRPPQPPPAGPSRPRPMRTAASGAAAALLQMHEVLEDDVGSPRDSGSLRGKADGPLQAAAAQATTVGGLLRAGEQCSHSLTCPLQAGSEVHAAFGPSRSLPSLPMCNKANARTPCLCDLALVVCCWCCRPRSWPSCIQNLPGMSALATWRCSRPRRIWSLLQTPQSLRVACGPLRRFRKLCQQQSWLLLLSS